MQVSKALFARRSVRKYKETPVEKQKLEYVLSAGNYAPSAMNNQDRQFIAVTKKEELARLNEVIESISDEATIARIKGRTGGKFDFFYSAPVLILACAKADGLRPAEDCATALQNMFLASLDVDLGSCWINQLSGKASLPKIAELLKEWGIKDGYEVYGCCALGYPDGNTKLSAPKQSSVVII